MPPRIRKNELFFPVPSGFFALIFPLLLPLVFFIFFSPEAWGKVYINIGAAKVKKSRIAVSPFVLEEPFSSPEHAAAGKKMNKRLKKNLKISGYFHILSPEAFIEDPASKAPFPYPESLRGFHWRTWKLIGADFLLMARYSVMEGEVDLFAGFYHVHSKKSGFRKKYNFPLSQIDSLADRLSNDIVKHLSGKKSIFETKIASIRSTSGSKKELFVMDWSGSRQRQLTYHRSIALSPSWSPKGDQLAYTAFVYNTRLKRRVAALFLYNLRTNKIRILSRRGGANIGADFLPGGREILVTLGIGPGNMDIFRLNLRTSAVIPLTKGPRGVIHVEPAAHPKTGRIVFSSDQSGNTMIYTMSRRGKDIKRITFAGTHNSTPDWDPYKNRIIFSGRSKGRFDLFLVNANGSGLKRLTSLRKANGRWANCESPSFSPDGRFAVFSSDLSGTYQLYIMNLDDLAIERITFDRHDYKSPKWSPYL